MYKDTRTNQRSQGTKTNEHGVQAMRWHATHHEPDETMLQELGGYAPLIHPLRVRRYAVLLHAYTDPRETAVREVESRCCLRDTVHLEKRPQKISQPRRQPHV